jgi:hypothetical protein
MVRPARRVSLAGESPVRVSAGAPGSRLQPGGAIRPSRAECRRPWKDRGANRRAATNGERNSLVILSAEGCLGGPSRSYHGEGDRQHPGPERVLDLPGVAGGGTLGQSSAEQERPYPAAWSGKDRTYKAGRLKSDGAGRESERPVVPVKARKTTRWREGAFLWSRRRGGKREGIPETAHTPNDKARQLQRKLWVCAKRSKTRRFHALYDRIYRSDVLWEAWRRVRSNRGAAAMDAETIQAVEQRGVGEFLAEIQAALRAGRCRLRPVKRRYIPKGDGKQPRWGSRR